MNLPTTAPHLVEVLEERECYRFRRLFRIVEARLRHRRTDGTWSPELTRVNFERGPAAAVLLHDPQADTVILTRQFRYPAHVAGSSCAGAAPDSGWLLEIPAGILEDDAGVEELARREVLEEVGYELRGDLECLGTLYPSPGASSERITLFLATVAPGHRVADGGGVAHEGEDIEVLAVPLDQALDLVRRGEIRDAKTVVALQRLALRRYAAAAGF